LVKKSSLKCRNDMHFLISCDAAKSMLQRKLTAI
jgi:hypothetical protein